MSEALEEYCTSLIRKAWRARDPKIWMQRQRIYQVQIEDLWKCPVVVTFRYTQIGCCRFEITGEYSGYSVCVLTGGR